MVTINVRNASLREVLDVIEKQTTYRFAYRDVVIDRQTNITVVKEKASVTAVLDVALNGRGMEYAIVSPQSIVITNIQEQVPQQIGTYRRVTGIVTDQNGDPIIGANVTVKGDRSRGTITDVEGQFSLSVPLKSILEDTSLLCKR